MLEILLKRKKIAFFKKNLNEALEDAIKTYAKKDEFIVIMHADLPLISNQHLDYLMNLIHQQKLLLSLIDLQVEQMQRFQMEESKTLIWQE